MRFTDVFGCLERSELSQMEAAELLGISERTFVAGATATATMGQAGLADRRLTTSRRASVAAIERMLGVYRDRVRWQRLSLQLPPSWLRAHFVKANVRVHEYPAGELAVHWGHRLADYDAAGDMVQPEPLDLPHRQPRGIPSRDETTRQPNDPRTETTG
jgi:hypothetical protein